MGGIRWLKTLVLIAVLACGAQLAFGQAEVSDGSFGAWLPQSTATTELKAQVEVQRRQLADLRGIITDLEKMLRKQEQQNADLREQLRELTKRQQPTPAEPEPYAKIVMEHIADCKACTDWLAGPEPGILRGSNWVVTDKLIDKPPQGVYYPRWQVCIGGKCGVIEYTPNFLQALWAYVERSGQRPMNFKSMRVIGLAIP